MDILLTTDRNIFLNILILAGGHGSIFSLVCKNWLSFVNSVHMKRNYDSLLIEGNIKLYTYLNRKGLRIDKVHIMHPNFLSYFRKYLVNTPALNRCLEYGNVINAKKLIDLSDGKLMIISSFFGCFLAAMKSNKLEVVQLVMQYLHISFDITFPSIIIPCIERAFESKNLSIINYIYKHLILVSNNDSRIITLFFDCAHRYLSDEDIATFIITNFAEKMFVDCISQDKYLFYRADLYLNIFSMFEELANRNIT